MKCYFENFQGPSVPIMYRDLKKTFNMSNPSFDRYNSVAFAYSHYVLLVIKANLINVSNNINAEK